MAQKQVLIIGEHPVGKDMARQFILMEYNVTCLEHGTSDFDINHFDELCLLTNRTEEAAIAEDNRVVDLLGELATKYDVARHGGKKLVCHLLLQNHATLQLLQLSDFKEDVKERMEVYPFTIEEVWSRQIVLDWEPVTVQSEKTVHLVIMGMSQMTESLSIQAALVAHYPNYVHEHSRRTRITIVDCDVKEMYDAFILKYKHLFDNSYYRYVNPAENKAVTFFHEPQYAKSREDFVDVEWEFVDASAYHPVVREKIELWAAAPSKQLLTLVFAYDDESRNLNEALHLPDVVYHRNIPVYVKQSHAAVLEQIKTEGKLKHLYPFGMLDRGYDVQQPFVQMAKSINYIYNLCYHDNIKNWTGKMRYAVELAPKECEQQWQELSMVKRMSNIYNAMTISTKMRSVGLEKADWDKFYDISQQDIELLAQVEHNRWSVEELILGWRPCTDEEQSKVEADIRQKDVLKKKLKAHYDLRAYNDLRTDVTGKSATIYDLCLCSCLPLIAKSFIDKKGRKE